jgi:predicted PurR-regulated permease PerM
MLQDSRPYTFDRVARLALTAGLFCGLIWLLGYLSDVLIPFAVALLLAYLINPLVLLVQKKIKRRSISVFTALVLVGGLIIILALLVIPMIVSEITHMGRVLSEVADNSALADRAANILPPDLWQSLQEYAARKDVQDFFRSKSFWKIKVTGLNPAMILLSLSIWGSC